MAPPVSWGLRRADAHLAEPVLEPGDRSLSLGADTLADAGRRYARERLLAHIGDQRAVEAEERVGDDERHDVALLRARLVGDHRRESARVVVEHLALAREQRGALRDHAGDGADLDRRLVVAAGGIHREHAALAEQELSERAQQAPAWRTVAE